MTGGLYPIKVRVDRRADGKWDFSLVHPNGRVLCGSDQGYENKEFCIQVAKGVATGGYALSGLLLAVEGEEETPIEVPQGYIFRVIRTKVGEDTVRVTLEPYTDIQHVEVQDGAEFITGTLAIDPWGPEPAR